MFYFLLKAKLSSSQFFTLSHVSKVWGVFLIWQQYCQDKGNSAAEIEGPFSLRYENF